MFCTLPLDPGDACVRGNRLCGTGDYTLIPRHLMPALMMSEWRSPTGDLDP